MTENVLTDHKSFTPMKLKLLASGEEFKLTGMSLDIYTTVEIPLVTVESSKSSPS
jgi:hypothetical protein